MVSRPNWSAARIFAVLSVRPARQHALKGVWVDSLPAIALEEFFCVRWGICELGCLRRTTANLIAAQRSSIGRKPDPSHAAADSTRLSRRTRSGRACCRRHNPPRRQSLLPTTAPTAPSGSTSASAWMALQLHCRIFNSLTSVTAALGSGLETIRRPASHTFGSTTLT